MKSKKVPRAGLQIRHKLLMVHTREYIVHDEEMITYRYRWMVKRVEGRRVLEVPESVPGI